MDVRGLLHQPFYLLAARMPLDHHEGYEAVRIVPQQRRLSLQVLRRFPFFAVLEQDLLDDLSDRRAAFVA